MKLKKVLIISFIVLVFLYATNPTKNQFVEYTENVIAESVQNSGVESTSFINQLFVSIAGKVGGEVSDVLYTRKNYVFFSIYEVSGIDFEYKYLGIARIFIELKSFIDTDSINQQFRDIVNLVNKHEELEEDYYASYEFEVNGNEEIDLEFTHKSGPIVELYLFDNDNFQLYIEQKDGVKVYEQKEISSGVVYSESYHLETGKYYVVIDNTDSGLVYPPINFENDICYYNIVIDKH
ncbi:MAG: hypothetical protein ACPKQO_01535 [Nitrososphaeraceae archaeon]